MISTYTPRKLPPMITTTTTTTTSTNLTPLFWSTTTTTAKFTSPINHLHNLVEFLLFHITPVMMVSLVKAINDHHVIYFPRVIIKKNTIAIKEWLLFRLLLQHSPIHQLLILIPLLVITHTSFPILLTINLCLPNNLLLLRRRKLHVVIKIQYRAVQILELDNWLITKSKRLSNIFWVASRAINLLLSMILRWFIFILHHS